MLRFFRQIRQRLLTDKKFSKYLLYAIGEILLVVIGILIALSINNWNQNRLERIEEKAILGSLKEDFSNAIEEFKTLNKIRDDIISAAKRITAITPDNVENLQRTYLDSLFSNTLSGPTYNNKAGSLNVLLTSGKINLVSNQDLKQELISWPGYIDDMIEDELIHNDIYTGKYCDILSKYISWNDLIKVYTLPRARFDEFTVDPMPDNPVSTSNYMALLANIEFINCLSRRASMCMITNNETNSLIDKANGIIAVIDSELSRE